MTKNNLENDEYCGCPDSSVELNSEKILVPRSIKVMRVTERIAIIMDGSVAISIAIAVAGAIAGRLANDALTKIIGIDPVELSNDAIETLAKKMNAAIEEGRKRDYENLVVASHEKFKQYETSKEMFLLDNIINSNNDALSGLRNLGTGAIAAWTTSVNNLLTAYLLKEDEPTARGIADRHWRIGMEFLDESRNYTRRRVTRCSCEGDAITGWDCWYRYDGKKVNHHYQKRSRAESRCDYNSQKARTNLIETMDALIFNSLEVVYGEWKKFSEKSSS